MPVLLTSQRFTVRLLITTVLAVVCLGFAATAHAGATTLTQESWSPVGTGAGSTPTGIAYTPNGKFAIVSDQNTAAVSAFAVGAGGQLTPIGSPVSAGAGADGIAINPAGTLVAVANSGANSVSVFQIGSSGALTQVGSPTGTGASSDPTNVAFSPDGSVLVVNDAGTNLEATYTVSSAGGLTAVSTAKGSTATAPLTGPDDLSFSPVAHAGQSLLAVTFLSGEVELFTVTDAGAITGGATASTGSQPYGVAFSPSGNLLAVANSESANVTVFALSSADTLTVDSTTAVGSNPEDVAFSPSGDLLAVADDGGPSSPGELTVDAVSASGTLTAFPGSPAATGGASEPFGVAFSPDGGEVALTDQESNLIDVFGVGPQAPPTASVSTPASGGSYALNATVTTAFSCAEGAGGTGLASCVDSNGATGGSGALNTTSAGTHTYSVTATSTDGLANTTTITYTVVATIAPPLPVNTAIPVIQGTPRVSDTLTCVPGSWTGPVVGFNYQWMLNTKAIQGATNATYVVADSDLGAGAELSCAVTATDQAGTTKPADSEPVAVIVTHRNGCPVGVGATAPTGIDGVELRTNQSRLKGAVHGAKYTERAGVWTYCLNPGDITATVMTNAKLAKFDHGYTGTRLKVFTVAYLNRVFAVRTDDPWFSVAGVRPGEAVSATTLSHPVAVAGYDYYVTRASATTDWILQASHGTVRSVGTAESALVGTTTKTRSRFFAEL